jgi:hypothetical protein
MKLKDNRNGWANGVLALMFRRAASFFPYAFVVYLFFVVLSLLSVTVREIIFWPALHGSIVALFLLALCDVSCRRFSLRFYLRSAFGSMFYVGESVRRLSIWENILIIICVGFAGAAVWLGAGMATTLVSAYVAFVIPKVIKPWMTVILLMVLFFSSMALSWFGPSGVIEEFSLLIFYLLLILLVEQLVRSK